MCYAKSLLAKHGGPNLNGNFAGGLCSLLGHKSGNRVCKEYNAHQYSIYDFLTIHIIHSTIINIVYLFLSLK